MWQKHIACLVLSCFPMAFCAGCTMKAIRQFCHIHSRQFIHEESIVCNQENTSKPSSGVLQAKLAAVTKKYGVPTDVLYAGLQIHSGTSAGKQSLGRVLCNIVRSSCMSRPQTAADVYRMHVCPQSTRRINRNVDRARNDLWT